MLAIGDRKWSRLKVNVCYMMTDLKMRVDTQRSYETIYGFCNANGVEHCFILDGETMELVHGVQKDDDTVAYEKVRLLAVAQALPAWRVGDLVLDIMRSALAGRR